MLCPLFICCHFISPNIDKIRPVLTIIRIDNFRATNMTKNFYHAKSVLDVTASGCQIDITDDLALPEGKTIAHLLQKLNDEENSKNQQDKTTEQN